jgi:hypothetical protein
LKNNPLKREVKQPQGHELQQRNVELSSPFIFSGRRRRFSDPFRNANIHCHIDLDFCVSQIYSFFSFGVCGSTLSGAHNGTIVEHFSSRICVAWWRAASFAAAAVRNRPF